MLNPWDQYRTARALFTFVRTNAKVAAGTQPVEYLAVGHSLGGGLARHMAAAFPCTAAITFNSSFVSNDFRLSAPYQGQIVDIFEDQDFLSKIAVLPDPNSFFRVSSRHQWYRFNNAEIGDLRGQHGIYQAATAMARIPVVCLDEQGKECEFNKTQYGDSTAQETGRDKASVSKLYCQAAPAEVVDHRQKYCG
jgi:pimeloyl-ACP methyl ester carboxylesterase